MPIIAETALERARHTSAVRKKRLKRQRFSLVFVLLGSALCSALYLAGLLPLEQAAYAVGLGALGLALWAIFLYRFLQLQANEREPRGGDDNQPRE